MGMSIATSSIRDWDKIDDTGTSVVFASDTKVTINTSSTTEKGYIYKRLDGSKGATYRVRIKAKGNLGFSINYPTATSKKIEHVINSEHWEEYELDYTIPDYGLKTQYVQIAIGHYTGFDGYCEITDIRVEAINHPLALAQVYANCLFVINDSSAGSITMHESFSQIGVDKEHLELQTVSNIVNVKIPAPVGGDIPKRSPVFQLNMDDSLATRNILPKAGGYSRSTGTVRVSFIDTTTGNLVDISALPICYMWFTALA